MLVPGGIITSSVIVTSSSPGQQHPHTNLAQRIHSQNSGYFFTTHNVESDSTLFTILQLHWQVAPCDQLHHISRGVLNRVRLRRSAFILNINLILDDASLSRYTDSKNPVEINEIAEPVSITTSVLRYAILPDNTSCSATNWFWQTGSATVRSSLQPIPTSV